MLKFQQFTFYSGWLARIFRAFPSLKTRLFPLKFRVFPITTWLRIPFGTTARFWLL